jgi:hypothetical protein
MNSNAEDLMCGAPSEVSEEQLRDVHIKLRWRDNTVVPSNNYFWSIYYQ